MARLDLFPLRRESRVTHIEEDRHSRRSRNQLPEELRPASGRSPLLRRSARDIPAGVCEAGDDSLVQPDRPPRRITTGIVPVAFWAASAAGVPRVTIKSTFSRTSSVARAGNRSSRPSADRYSMTEARPQRTRSSRSPAVGSSRRWRHLSPSRFFRSCRCDGASLVSAPSARARSEDGASQATQERTSVHRVLRPHRWRRRRRESKVPYQGRGDENGLSWWACSAAWNGGTSLPGSSARICGPPDSCFARAVWPAGPASVRWPGRAKSGAGGHRRAIHLHAIVGGRVPRPHWRPRRPGR